MKKLLALLLAILMLFSLAACGEKDEEKEKEKTGSKSTYPQSAEEALELYLEVYLSDGDYELLLPKKMWSAIKENYDCDDEDIEDAVNEIREEMAELYGENVSYEIQITDEEEIEADELEHIAEIMEGYYGKSNIKAKNVTAGVYLEASIVYETEDGSEEESLEGLMFICYDDGWFILSNAQGYVMETYPFMVEETLSFYLSPYSEPPYIEPGYEEPSYEEPSYEEPSYEDPQIGTEIPYLPALNNPTAYEIVDYYLQVEYLYAVTDITQFAPAEYWDEYWLGLLGYTTDALNNGLEECQLQWFYPYTEPATYTISEGEDIPVSNVEEALSFLTGIDVSAVSQVQCFDVEVTQYGETEYLQIYTICCNGCWYPVTEYAGMFEFAIYSMACSAMLYSY